MSIDRVQQPIQKIQEYVFDFYLGPDDFNLDAPANNSEMSTRYIIIDPVLRALGWDLSDPSQCIVENVTEGGFPDYTLLDHRGTPVIVVEAKRIDRDTRYAGYRDKVAGYGDSIPSANVVVITNGQYWDIFYRERERVVDESQSGRKPLGLDWSDTRENSQRLHRHLGKGRYWPA